MKRFKYMLNQENIQFMQKHDIYRYLLNDMQKRVISAKHLFLSKKYKFSANHHHGVMTRGMGVPGLDDKIS